MTQSNSNAYYFAIDSVDLSSYVVDISFSRTNSGTDITAGANTTHMERAAGLDDTKIDVKIGYEVGSMPTIFAKIRPGQIFQMEYGPEGTASGKPRHVQNFLVVGAPFSQAVKKSHMVFAFSAEGSEAASTDMYAGGVY